MEDTTTVKIFLTQGSPTSVRTAELSDWTGKDAATVIHGGQANGLTVWKDAKGVSLKEKEEKDIQ